MVKRSRRSTHLSRQMPATPSESDCGILSGEDEEEENVEGEYQIIDINGRIVSSRFDHVTSLGSAMLIAEKTFGKPPIGYEYNLVFGVEHPKILTDVYSKLRHVFSECSSVSERKLWYILYKSSDIYEEI